MRQDSSHWLLTTLVKELDTKAHCTCYDTVFKFYGKSFRLAYFNRRTAANYEVLEQFKKSTDSDAPGVVSSRRQPHIGYGVGVNGLPVASIELKNPGTGQTWKNAVRQYMQDRDRVRRCSISRRRALVHFAADPNEVHMTTRLAGRKTFSWPFNRGSHPGPDHLR